MREQIWQNPGRRAKVKRWFIFCTLLFILLAYTTLIGGAKAETDPKTKDDPKSSAAATAEEKVYKLSPPGKDPRTSRLLAGEEALRSGELREAREAFEKVLELDSRNAQAHYFLGLMEYEEGNIEKAKTRFQIAHECLESFEAVDPLVIDDEHVQIEFPEDYESRISNKDGWYISPKDPDAFDKTVHSLEAGSTYRLALRSKRKYSWVRRGAIGLALVVSFLLAR